MGRKGEAFTGTTIKDMWTIRREGGNRGRSWGGLRWWGGVGRKGRKLYLNNNKKIFKKKNTCTCRSKCAFLQNAVIILQFS